MKKDKRPRFLICRIDRIGDVVLSTPLPREIKKNFPDSFVAVLVRKYTKDIYLNNPFVDEIIIYDEKSTFKSFLKMLKVIRSFKFTHAFMLLPDERLNYLLFLSGIKTRIGVGHKLYQFLTFTKYVDRKKYVEERHEADYCLDMLRKIGIKPASIEPEIYLNENEKVIAQNFKQEFAPNGEFLIGINSTSGNSSPNLSYAEYRKLIEKLAAVKKFRVIITDLNPPEEIQNIDGVFYPMTKDTLRESIIKFSALNVLISSSTGPMHICAALKVPTISVFCPLPACSPKLWGPLGNKSIVLLPRKEYCQTECPGNPKICRYEGNSGLNAEKIFDEVMKFFGLS